jgi:hypothetical protein
MSELRRRVKRLEERRPDKERPELRFVRPGDPQVEDRLKFDFGDGPTFIILRPGDDVPDDRLIQDGENVDPGDVAVVQADENRAGLERRLAELKARLALLEGKR